jgi:hypothetical protein
MRIQALGPTERFPSELTAAITVATPAQPLHPYFPPGCGQYSKVTALGRSCGSRSVVARAQAQQGARCGAVSAGVSVPRTSLGDVEVVPI